MQDAPQVLHVTRVARRLAGVDHRRILVVDHEGARRKHAIAHHGFDGIVGIGRIGAPAVAEVGRHAQGGHRQQQARHQGLRALYQRGAGAQHQGAEQHRGPDAEQLA
jgi:hypothetical protein